MSDETTPRPKPAPPKTRLGVKPTLAIQDEVKEKPKTKKPFVLRPHMSSRQLQNNPLLIQLRKELAEKEEVKKSVKRNPRKK